MSARLVVLSSVVAAVAAMPIAQNLHDRAFYEEKFFNWLSEHKIQARDGQHFAAMIQNFANNDDIIANHNDQKLGFELGHNQFSHMSLNEWRDYVGLGLRRPMNEEPTEIHAAPADVSTLSGSVDWTTKGAVTDVKDQGQCGSCWSFSATGAMEGAYKIKYGSMPSKLGFSEQNLVDCDNRHNGGTDMGCNGGLMDSAFKWVEKNGGLCTEEGYPYKAVGGDCQTTCAKAANSKIASYVDVAVNSDSAMMSALAVGPVSVAIQADTKEFQLYKSGVFTATCGYQLDHGVLAVGYGTDASSGLDFYKVKNSWGKGWGESGYIRFVKGISQKQGQCGILSGPPSYPKFA
jgi:C1A family cysteine protease